jgi:hypothetical protein
MLSIGPWLLSGTVDLSTFYNSNLYSSPTSPLAGPGFDVHPGVLAELNEGIHDTKLYGSFDSALYPTFSSQNTFNPKAGFIQTYSPLPDLTFSAEGDAAHNTLAPAVVGAIPNPIVSPANPGPTGAAGVVANQPLVVSPNDTISALATVYKQFNRAYLSVSGTISETAYEASSSQDYENGSLSTAGGIWISPWFYAFASASDAKTVPVVGTNSNSYSARGGIGSDKIGVLQGTVYYGQQGSSTGGGGGTAGGDIYGGTITYFPTDLWTMNLTVNRIRNRSDISATNALGLNGLPLSGVAVLTSSSTQNTSVSFSSTYTLSAQTSVYILLSDTRTAYLDMPVVDTTWLASTGINYQMWTDLSLSLNYSFARYLSPQPQASYTQNVVTLGSHYKF